MKVVVITSTYPMVCMLMGTILLKERKPQAVQIFSLLLGLVGTLTVVLRNGGIHGSGITNQS